MQEEADEVWEPDQLLSSLKAELAGGDDALAGAQGELLGAAWAACLRPWGCLPGPAWQPATRPARAPQPLVADKDAPRQI